MSDTDEVISPLLMDRDPPLGNVPAPGGRRALLVAGNFSSTPSGLNIAGRITEVTLNDTTWTALPLAPLTMRNAMRVQNPTSIEIKINYDPLVVGYVGIVVGPSGENYWDITDAIMVYAKSSSGNPVVNIEEIS